MEKLYTGKTKDVYKLNDTNNLLVFKDSMTGTNGVFDPGANVVGLEVKGAGHYGLAMSAYYFEKIQQAGIPTHYISSDLEKNTMTVKNVGFFGKGIEVIGRYVATGSFIRRYGGYIADGTSLDSFIEVSLKDDQRGDPFISPELLEHFGILTQAQYEEIHSMSVDIGSIIRDDLAEKELKLYDFKLEFGTDNEGNILLIDELSGGNMRVYKGEQAVNPIELAKTIILYWEK